MTSRLRTGGTNNGNGNGNVNGTGASTRLVVPKVKRRKGNPIRTPAILALQRQQETRETTDRKHSDVQDGRFRSPSEAFYVGAMLNPSASDYREACHNFAKRQEVWQSTCQLVRLTPPRHSLAGQSFTKKQHFNDRAALVIEESIHVLSEAISRRWRYNSSSSNSSNSNKHTTMRSTCSITIKRDPATMNVELTERTFNSESHVVFFEFTLPDRAPPFTKEQLFHLRTGTIVECLPASMERTRRDEDMAQILLACVCMTNRQLSAKTRSFIVMTVPQYEQRHLRCGLWAITPLTSLVSPFRQLESCQLIQSGHAPVPFLQTLLGQAPEQHQQPVMDLTLAAPSDSGRDSTTSSNSSTSTCTSSSSSSSSSSDGEDSDSDSSDSDTGIGEFIESEKENNVQQEKDDKEENNSHNVLLRTPERNPRQDTCKKTPPQSPPRKWSLPTLNTLQAKAANDFLDSPTGSISLVQGPPGSGKSHFLVATIGLYLQRVLLETEAAAIAAGETPHMTRSPPHYAGRRRKKGKALLVSAPTNKAVSVLASRFMATISGEAKGTTPCHELKVILVGDHEKLVEDTLIYTSTNNGNENPENDIPDHVPMEETIKSMACLKRIFVYKFLNNVEEELKAVLQTQDQSKQPRNQKDDNEDNDDGDNESVSERNYKMQRFSLLRLLHQYIDIGYLFKEGMQSRAENLRDALLKMAEKESTQKGKNKRIKVEKMDKRDRKFHKLLEIVAEDVKTLINTKEMSHRVTCALIRSADLIFCTLAASGASHFKSRGRPFRVRDLIVDEAAAATEPEIGIPFHLCPDRLLAVGDPMQLPATVFSPIAKQYGLEKSLHERLMKDCNYPYTMLRQQYRMRPQISQFPSQRFYRGRLKDSGEVTCPTYVSPYPLIVNPNTPFVFQEVRGEECQREGGSYQNWAEAKAVVDWIVQLRSKASHNDPNWFRNEKVRIITFYQAQVDLINSLLKPLGFGHRKSGLVASTVDSSQGCEANLVIVSFVRTCRKRPSNVWQAKATIPNTSNMPPAAPGTPVPARSIAGFLTDNRRINVALTRAKFELICIGSVGHLLENEQLETLHALAQQAQARGCIVRGPVRLKEERPAGRTFCDGGNKQTRKRSGSNKEVKNSFATVSGTIERMNFDNKSRKKPRQRPHGNKTT